MTPFEFKKYPLPESVAPEDLTPELARILKGYSVVSDHDFDPHNIDSYNEILDKFTDQDAYVVRDEEGRVLAIANYYADKKHKRGWLDGIVALERNRGVGKFAMQQLGQLAVSQGFDRLEFKALDDAIPFYQKLGARQLDNTEKPHMSISLHD